MSTAVRRHDFNSEWWGDEVGIVDDPAFFARPAEDQARLLAPYAWTEFKASELHRLPVQAIARAGFVAVGLNLSFRLNLARVTLTESARGLVCRTAREHRVGLDLASMRPFAHERFALLPGMNAERFNTRYLIWAEQLLARSPETSLEILHDGRVQGWFLSEPRSGGLFLGLAMLAEGAAISGHLLYQAAMGSYSARGHRLGFADFSAENTAVLNIYASCGARFLAPQYHWIRFPA